MVHRGQHVKVTQVSFALDLEGEDPSAESDLSTRCELYEKRFYSSAALAVE